MEAPKVDGLEVLELHDFGGCGEVYRAVDASGRQVALKVFDDLSVSRTLLIKMSQRLQVDAWPLGVMPVLAEHLQRSPLYRVMPWMADRTEGGSWTPRSLQHLPDGLPAADAWRIIRQLAEALGQMHLRHVPHGNLKPGNVFLDGEGRVLLSDWCLGNMPGVHVFRSTDALLYQPPEQLLDASGYLDEQGYGWDVFAFGVTAFRLLTGGFPRCDEVFRKLAPSPGSTRCDGMTADARKIAAHLIGSELQAWPAAPECELERRMREWIVRCLELDPARRPSSMAELCSGFELIEQEVAREDQQLRLVAVNRSLRRRLKGLGIAMAAAITALVVFAVLWSRTVDRLDAEVARSTREREDLRTAVNEARNSETVALRNAEEARRLMIEQREEHARHLAASRWVGDRLLVWAMDTDRRRLPPLDGRQERLKQLEEYFIDFAEHSKDMPELAHERARVMLQLAEISIAKGDLAGARRCHESAVEAWKPLAKDAEIALRLATNSLRVAILHDSGAKEDALAAYRRAREALAELPREGVDAKRLDQLWAVLDLREARWLVAAGEDRKALEQLMRATQSLNRLAAQRPDLAVLKSTLADCYLSSASILDGIGRMGDAREVRQLASELLVKLQKERPGDPVIEFELVSAYAAMAEVALLSGDLEAAGNRATQALQLLKRQAARRPPDDEMLLKHAELLGVQAGIRRDLGKPLEAHTLYQEAESILAEARVRRPEHPMFAYRLAMTWWQKARLPAAAGSADDVGMLQRAGGLLNDLVEGADAKGPDAESLLRARAYVAADLGHAHQLRKQRDKARESFGHALEHWQELVGLRPDSEEYRLGEQWCREELLKLK